jgi:two-component system, sensor histidine kinase RegB
MMDSIGEPYITSRRFQDKGDRAHSGLGLGFFIAKTLLERSGATVTFSNCLPPRTGAQVIVSWPRTTFELPPGAFSWPGVKSSVLKPAAGARAEGAAW